VTQVVLRASVGASEHLYIARQNIAQAIRVLKKEGFWIAGLENDPAAVPLGEFHSDGPLALVVGSEGDGLGRLVRDSCDYLIKIPIVGRIDSLNASVAGSIAMFSLNRRS
jgi:23S rRNA (guanosine2251-2'-O)-methyltransferase